MTGLWVQACSNQMLGWSWLVAFVFTIASILFSVRFGRLVIFQSQFLERKIESNTVHGCAEIWNFSSIVQLDTSRVSAVNKWYIELDMRREIPFLLAAMYYFVNFINTLRTRRSSRFKKRTHCHSFMAIFCKARDNNNYYLSS